MARLRQLHPSNYVSSSNIDAEFDALVRYLNACELGNKTISELLAVLFDEDGVFDGPIEMRLDTSEGLQYRVGEYASSDTGWQNLATIASIRGTAGQSVGTIEGPFFFNRQEFTATSSQTVFSYTFDDSTEDVAVFTDGILNAEADYTADSGAGTVTFGSAMSGGEVVTIWSLRTQSVTNYKRSDITATASQAVFPFVHTADDTLQVYRNGVLQIEGGANDYTSSASSNTVTFTSGLSGGDVVTILTVENLSIQNVAGMMFEDEYTDGNGLIDWTKIAVDNGEITQAKVANLVTDLAAKGNLTVAASAPVSPSSGDLWMDTSVTPNILKFYDGTSWLNTSPDSTLPAFITSNANQYVRVNGTGTALEYGNIDFSAYVPKTYMGAANGVASLDSGAKLPAAQLPEIYATRTMSIFQSSTVANGDYFVARIWKETVRIDGLAGILSAGTCTVQIKVDGSTVGSTYNLSTTISDNTFGTVIEVDGTSASKLIEIVVTSASSSADMEIGLSVATVSV